MKYTLVLLSVLCLSVSVAVEADARGGRGGRGGGGGGFSRGGGGGMSRGGGGMSRGGSAGRSPSMSRPSSSPSRSASPSRPSGGASRPSTPSFGQQGGRPGGGMSGGGRPSQPSTRPSQPGGGRPGGGGLSGLPSGGRPGQPSGGISGLPSGGRPGQPSSRPGGGMSGLPGGGRPGQPSGRPGQPSGRPGEAPSRQDLSNFLNLPSDGSRPSTRPGQGQQRPGQTPNRDDLSNNRQDRRDTAGDNRQDRRDTVGDNRQDRRDTAGDNRQDRRDSATDNRQDRVDNRTDNRQSRRDNASDNRQQRLDQRRDRASDVRRATARNYPRMDFWRNNPYWARWRVNRPYRWATWGALTGWFGWGAGASETYYDYGGDVYYDEQNIYYGDDAIATTEEYAEQAIGLAAGGDIQQQPADTEWLPLGVFALTDQQAGEPTMFFQLAVAKDGTIAGTYYNATTNVSKPLQGSVDPQTQRAAWSVGDNADTVVETGIYNLTEPETTALLHFGAGKTQTWLLVRLEDPDEPQAAAAP